MLAEVFRMEIQEEPWNTCIDEFLKIETVPAERTKVAIFRRYVCTCNDLMNQDLIKII